MTIQNFISRSFIIVFFTQLAFSSDVGACLLTDLKKEVKSLKERIEVLEKKQNNTAADVHKKLDAHQRHLENSKEINSILIKYGNNPDGKSAFHYAIKMGDVDAINILIANGADINSRYVDALSSHIFIPLSSAARYNQLEIAKVLLSYGADVNGTAREDYPYIMDYAAQYASRDFIEFLIENGSIINKIDRNLSSKKTPLHTACRYGNYDAVVALVNGGAKIDGNNTTPYVSVDHWDGGTPLDWAAGYLKYSDNPQNLEIVKFLVENGATRRLNVIKHDSIPCNVIKGYLKSVNR